MPSEKMVSISRVLKGKLLDEQKQEIKSLVEELTQQVEAFVKQQPKK